MHYSIRYNQSSAHYFSRQRGSAWLRSNRHAIALVSDDRRSRWTSSRLVKSNTTVGGSFDCVVCFRWRESKVADLLYAIRIDTNSKFIILNFLKTCVLFKKKVTLIWLIFVFVNYVKTSPKKWMRWNVFKINRLRFAIFARTKLITTWLTCEFLLTATRAWVTWGYFHSYSSDHFVAV